MCEFTLEIISLFFLPQIHPKVVEGFDGHKVVAIATGDEFSLVVDEKGLPWVWGKGDKGQVRRLVRG